jgi:hypothetical protein
MNKVDLWLPRDFQSHGWSLWPGRRLVHHTTHEALIVDEYKETIFHENVVVLSPMKSETFNLERNVLARWKRSVLGWY